MPAPILYEILLIDTSKKIYLIAQVNSSTPPNNSHVVCVSDTLTIMWRFLDATELGA